MVVVGVAAFPVGANGSSIDDGDASAPAGAADIFGEGWEHDAPPREDPQGEPAPERPRGDPASEEPPAEPKPESAAPVEFPMQHAAVVSTAAGAGAVAAALLSIAPTGLWMLGAAQQGASPGVEVAAFVASALLLSPLAAGIGAGLAALVAHGGGSDDAATMVNAWLATAVATVLLVVAVPVGIVLGALCSGCGRCPTSPWPRPFALPPLTSGSMAPAWPVLGGWVGTAAGALVGLGVAAVATTYVGLLPMGVVPVAMLLGAGIAAALGGTLYVMASAPEPAVADVEDRVRAVPRDEAACDPGCVEATPCVAFGAVALRTAAGSELN